MPITEKIKDGMQPLSLGDILSFGFSELIAPLTYLAQGGDWLQCREYIVTVLCVVSGLIQSEQCPALHAAMWLHI